MTLRELFINWLTASRFIQSLEARINEQRQLYTEWLAEKDSQIKQLRSELASAKGSPAGSAYSQRYDTPPQKPPVVPEFTGPDDWVAELNREYEKEQSDGLRSEGRKEVYQPTADDGA